METAALCNVIVQSGLGLEMPRKGNLKDIMVLKSILPRLRDPFGDKGVEARGAVLQCRGPWCLLQGRE